MVKLSPALIFVGSEAGVLTLALRPAGPAVMCRGSTGDRYRHESPPFVSPFWRHDGPTATDIKLQNCKNRQTDTYQRMKVLSSQMRLTKRCTRLVARHLE